VKGGKNSFLSWLQGRKNRGEKLRKAVIVEQKKRGEKGERNPPRCRGAKKSWSPKKAGVGWKSICHKGKAGETDD